MKDVNYQLDECPVQKILNLFQRKWNLRIIYELSKHVLRQQFNEVPPHVEYSLTESAKALDKVFQTMREWGNRYL